MGDFVLDDSLVGKFEDLADKISFHRDVIYRKACGLVGRDVVLHIKKWDAPSEWELRGFEREVTIVRVLDNCIIAKGCSGMEWSYNIADSEWIILDVQVRV